jgi:hypothetical protein
MTIEPLAHILFILTKASLVSEHLVNLSFYQHAIFNLLLGQLAIRLKCHLVNSSFG